MPRPPAAEQVRRNASIVEDRARGLTWATVADRAGITERRAQQIWGERHGAQVSLDPPSVVVADVLAAIDSVIEDAALIAEHTENDAIALGAINTRLRALAARFALMRACGLLPENLEHMTQPPDNHAVDGQTFPLIPAHSSDT